MTCYIERKRTCWIARMGSMMVICEGVSPCLAWAYANGAVDIEVWERDHVNGGTRIIEGI